MRVLAVVSFALFCAVQARKSHKVENAKHIKDLLTGDFQVIEHDRMAQHDLCMSLRCHHNEVCVMKLGSAICVKKRHIERFRSQKKPAFTTVVHKKNEAKAEKAFKELTKPKHERKSTTHRFDPNDKRTECDEKHLQAVGERMLKWFGDIHASLPTHSKPTKKHTVRCDAEVEWMFNELDLDNDAILTVRELHTIQDDPYERCMKPFVDRCDQDADDDIDLDEWCDCFTFTNKEEEEPLCHREAHKIDPHDPDTFSPRCDTDGFYRVEQCFKGDCWCVDKFGREFDHSRVKDARPDCGQYAEED